MSENKILVVEDEKDIAKLLRYNLQREKYRVIVAHDAESALKIVKKDRPDLIILDIMLPKMDGLEFLQTIQPSTDVPVLLLTAKKSEVDRILGLKLGAADYIIKPFSMGELLARIAGHLRRAVGKTNGNGKKRISVGRVDIDFDRHEILVNGRWTHLTPKEFAILKHLIEADGKVLSRDQLLELIWGLDKNMEIDTRTVDQHIARLRRKIGPEGHHIRTVPNFGYKIKVN